jgi:hypothetical protein
VWSVKHMHWKGCTFATRFNNSVPTVSFFHRHTEHGFFIAQKACNPRDIRWQLRCSRQRRKKRSVVCIHIAAEVDNSRYPRARSFILTSQFFVVLGEVMVRRRLNAPSILAWDAKRWPWNREAEGVLGYCCKLRHCHSTWTLHELILMRVCF